MQEEASLSSGSEQSPGSPSEATAHAATASQLAGATGPTTRGGTATAEQMAAAYLYLLQAGVIGPGLRFLPWEEPYLVPIVAKLKARLARLRAAHQRMWEEEHPDEDPANAPALPMPPPITYKPPAEEDEAQFIGPHADLMRNGAPIAARVAPFLQLASLAGVHVGLGQLRALLPVDGDNG